MLNNTEQTLAIYSKRSEQGKSLQRVYRQLFKPELYETAYSESMPISDPRRKAPAKKPSMECQPKGLTTSLRQSKPSSTNGDQPSERTSQKAMGEADLLESPQGMTNSYKPL